MKKTHPAALATAAIVGTSLLIAPWRLWTMYEAQATPTPLAVTQPAPVPQTTTTWTYRPNTPTQSATQAPAATPADPSATPAATPSKDTRPVVYLTFDDGPDARNTPTVLSILRSHGVHATFFMIGEEAAANPDLVTAVRADGHAIGNHTYTHPWLTQLSSSAVSSQLTRTNAALGGGVSCMRAPGGLVDGQVRATARELGLPIISWSHDTRDWSRPGTSSIIAAATSGKLSASQPRIVLMHDGGGPRAQTIAALPTVIEKLQAQGADFRTLPACRG